jgi:hypothetical protein
MKRYVLIGAVAVVCLFWSCSKDSASTDTGSGVINPAGVYKMTSVTSSVPTDLNGDGIKSNEQMLETACYNNNLLTVNSDYTFSKTQKGVNLSFSGSGSTITCFTDPTISGTWTYAQNAFALHYTEGGSAVVETYVITNTTLKFLIPSGQVVGLVNNQPAYLTSNIEITYTKQ